MNAHAQDGTVIHHGEMLDAGQFHKHIKREWFDMHLYFATGFEQVPDHYTIELFARDGTLLRELQRSI